MGLINVGFACLYFPTVKGLSVGYLLMTIDLSRPRGSAQIIEKCGAKTVLYVHQPGRGTRQAITHFEPVGVSTMAMPMVKLRDSLSVKEIYEILIHLSQVAKQAKKAGF